MTRIGPSITTVRRGREAHAALIQSPLARNAGSQWRAPDQAPSGGLADERNGAKAATRHPRRCRLKGRIMSLSGCLMHSWSSLVPLEHSHFGQIVDSRRIRTSATLVMSAFGPGSNSDALKEHGVSCLWLSINPWPDFVDERVAI
jgi:hypothetical protein